jgi:DNA-binding response OmpR family regulator
MSPHSNSVITAFVGKKELLHIREALATENVELIHASSLQESVSAATTVILYDTDETGPWIAFLQTIRDFRPAVRVILLTSFADDRMWVEGLSNGAYDLLQKPYHPRELRSVVRSALSASYTPAPSGAWRSEEAATWRMWPFSKRRIPAI